MLRSFFLAGALAAPLPLAAQVISGNNPDAIVNIARGFGSVELETDSQGYPMITGRIDGVRYGILFYGCADERGCNSIQFIGLFDSPGPDAVNRVNSWNADRRYGTAFVEEDGDIVFNWAINLDHGVVPQNLEDSFAIWSLALPDFAEFLYQ